MQDSFYLQLLPFHSCLMLHCGSFMGCSTFTRVTASSWAYPQASIPSGRYLFCHRAAPSSLTLLFPLFFPSGFLPLLRHFHRGTKSLADWPSCGPQRVLAGAAMSGTWQPQASSSHRGPNCSPPAAKPFHWHPTQPLRDERLQP